MPLIPRYRRYPSAVRPEGPMSPAAEIRFILARYDDGAIPPAVLAVIEQLRAKDRPHLLADGSVDAERSEEIF